MTQPSKADRIRKLLHLTNAVIAERIGCRVEYVRAVRQRTSESGNPIDPPTSRAWKEANPDRVKAATKRWLDSNRDHVNAYRREWYRNRRAEARAS